jgi:hypothetical protein
MLSTNPLDPYSVAKSFNFIVAVNSKIHRPPCLTELRRLYTTAAWHPFVVRASRTRAMFTCLVP